MSEIVKQIQFLCDEKGLDFDVVLQALESALAAAYRKDFGNKQQNIKVKFDPETGDLNKMKVWDEKEVVPDYTEEELEASQQELTKRREQAKNEGREMTEEDYEGIIRFNPKNQIMLSEAKKIVPQVKVGDIIKIDLEVPGDFGRMAAQTAKQVIIQKIREAERNSMFDDFKDQEGSIVQGIIQKKDKNGAVLVDLGKVTGILLPSEQIHREMYRIGTRMKFYVLSVEMTNRGPEILLSRKDKRMVEVVFEQEIPEIASGEVVIKGIARDAGNRSKVAVFTDDETIDPIGSCIGQKGNRITTIIEELGGEKIDVIQYSDDVKQYIKNALAPAKVEEVELNEDDKIAVAKVLSDQFSLAIGKDGQNVRLAAELTEWRIRVEDLGGEQEAISSDDNIEDIKQKQNDKNDKSNNEQNNLEEIIEDSDLKSDEKN